MSDAEKTRKYDELVELLQDRLALEKHYCVEGLPRSTIDAVHIDGYEAVVRLVFGRGPWDRPSPELPPHLRPARE